MRISFVFNLKCARATVNNVLINGSLSELLFLDK